MNNVCTGRFEKRLKQLQTLKAERKTQFRRGEAHAKTQAETAVKEPIKTVQPRDQFVFSTPEKPIERPDHSVRQEASESRKSPRFPASNSPPERKMPSFEI